MAEKLQPVRGTHDLLPDDAMKYDFIVDTARRVGSLYGFEPFYTPIFEFTDVFSRTLGDTSDVVNKEMYTFVDRGGESITLRPEFTAGVARAFISNGLQQNLPLKLFSHGPVFRYERPQKGRQRQFHQVNFEYLGHGGPMADAEMIALAYRLLHHLGITDFKVNINSLGDAESRAQYTEAFKKFLSGKKEKLSEDSKNRFEKNPLRILDSKDPGDKELLKDAPLMKESLNAASSLHLFQVTKALEVFGIPFEINPRIVRGLDYYNHVVFEFISDSDGLGSQNTILAGGRYDGLIKQMGGSDVPAIGFAAGIERLSLMLVSLNVPAEPFVVVLFTDFNSELQANNMAEKLRSAGKACDLVFKKNIGKGLEKAAGMNASHVIILGDEEIKTNIATVKNMITGEQKKIPMDRLADDI